MARWSGLYATAARLGINGAALDDNDVYVVEWMLAAPPEEEEEAETPDDLAAVALSRGQTQDLVEGVG